MTTEQQQKLVELAEACVAYDEAMMACANEPEKMDSFCTATGEDLDALYLAWRDKAYRIVGKPMPTPPWRS